jgi:hypothetical protein
MDIDSESQPWYAGLSLDEELFGGTLLRQVIAAFRRRSEDEPQSSSSSATFKKELWDILSGTRETSEEFVGKLVRGQGRKAAICGKIWGKDDLAYRCLDCGVGPCSAICAECFINGDHKNHNYVMYHSAAGGCCDCGDVEAWLPSGNCCFHGDSDCRLLQELHPSVGAHLYTAVSSVLWVHCASISSGNYPFVDDAIEWLLDVAESCTMLRELVGDVFIQRLPPGDPENPDIVHASRCIDALILLIQNSLQISVPIPVSYFALHRPINNAAIPSIDSPEVLFEIEAPTLFLSFINTHLFCLGKSNKLLLTIVLLPAVKKAFGESFIRRYHTMIQILIQQPWRHGVVDEFCASLQVTCLSFQLFHFKLSI